MTEHINKSGLTWVLTISIMIWANLLPAQEKSSPEKIRIAVATSSLAFLVPFVAKDRGFYLKNGSDVELIQMRPNVAMKSRSASSASRSANASFFASIIKCKASALCAPAAFKSKLSRIFSISSATKPCVAGGIS